MWVRVCGGRQGIGWWRQRVVEAESCGGVGLCGGGGWWRQRVVEAEGGGGRHHLFHLVRDLYRWLAVALVAVEVCMVKRWWWGVDHVGAEGVCVWCMCACGCMWLRGGQMCRVKSPLLTATCG